MITRRMPARTRAALTRAFAAVVAIAVVVVGSAVPASATSAAQSDGATLTKSSLNGVTNLAGIVGSDFVPGSIIADELFYDANAMTVAEIQAFLTAKGGTCTNGKCLSIGRFAVDSRPISISDTTGNVKCQAFTGGSNLSAAEIIYRAQVACSISARVILVTLQKEQGLITKTAPSDYALIHAMGMACPDTSPCQAYAEGFGNQIYLGARQLMTYKASRFATQPGVRSIGFHPNAGCGSTQVNIQNYATAALYAYTPYQPNGAALANLRTTGDSCSSYGNRNFWVYYNDWFGTTVGRPPVLTANTTVGEPASYLLARDLSGVLWIYPHNGAGAFGTPGQVGSSWNSMNSFFSAGDFDGDGIGDIIARDGAGALWRYSRDGSGGWKPRVQIGSGWNVYKSVFPVEDFNLDGKTDIMAITSGGAMYVYLGNGKGGAANAVQVGRGGWQLYSDVFGAGDFDGDGIPDIIARDAAGELLLYTGGGMNPANFLAITRIGGGWNQFSVVDTGGDLTGDGVDDILARDSNGTLYRYPGTGTGGVGAATPISGGWDQYSLMATSKTVVPPVTPPTSPAAVAGFGDVDGDGQRDVLGRDSTGILWLYPGNGYGGFLDRRRVGSGWQGFTALLGASDINGDNKSDILARDAAGTLWLYAGAGGGTWLAGTQVSTGWGGYDILFSPGDFDGDRRADILGRDPAGKLWLFSGDGAGGFGAARQVGAGWNIFSSIFAAGDDDGDGKQDVFARETTGALWIYPGNGVGGWGNYRKVGAGWNIFNGLSGTTDFNGDGDPDVFARETNGDLWLYPTNGKAGWRVYKVIARGWNDLNWFG